MTEGAPRTSHIGQAWLVIVLAVLYAGALAGVQAALGGKIARNQRDETYAVIPSLVPGADRAKTREVVVTGRDGEETRVYEAFASDGALAGWIVPASGPGFADRIEVLIGLDSQVRTITGLYVLEQKETPGLGNLITGEDFLARFKGKPAEVPLTVVKSEPQSDTEVRALTGATVSSTSVADIVNAALANLTEPIRKL